MKVKKIYNKVIKVTAVAIAAPSYAIAKTAKAIVYGVTENQTARDLADLYEVGGEILMIGALGAGEEL